MSRPLEDFLHRHVDAGTVPGAVAVLAPANDDSPEIVAVGSAEVGGAPLSPDAIFRIQSMTKAVTAVAALRLVEEGRLGLDDGLEEWLPELADRRVLRTPSSPLDDVVAAERSITLRHLLTNTSGYGSIMDDSPLARVMAENGTEAGPEPPSLGVDEWLERLTELPLAFQPGDGWRYHHSFGILGVLLSRLDGRSAGEHLRERMFEPLGMTDTGYWAPESEASRLPAAYRPTAHGLVEIEPAGGGFYRGEPPFDVSHGELVSTAHDYVRFLRMLARGGALVGGRLLTPESVALLTSDQVPTSVKTPDSFFPGFWQGMGWGFGVAVQTEGAHAGRYGWSGGQGTDFFVDPDGTIGLLLTQVELGEAMFPVLAEFQELAVGR